MQHAVIYPSGGSDEMPRRSVPSDAGAASLRITASLDVHGGFPYAARSVLQTRSILLAAGGVLASLLLAGLLFWLILRGDRTGRVYRTGRV